MEKEWANNGYELLRCWCSSQVTGTMLIYCLFMVELFRSDPIESLDEVIYWVNAVSRVLEFVVALCVVAYGTWESLFGEWSWMGASVIIIHSYFNVWLRAQSGWRSFLLRQEAAKKINSLPKATTQQLQEHNDVCSICFQVSLPVRAKTLKCLSKVQQNLTLHWLHCHAFQSHV